MSQGFAPIRDDWLARAAHVGQEITARTVKQTLIGRFETIDLDGQLVLQNDLGRHVIAAAEVFFKDDAHVAGN